MTDEIKRPAPTGNIADDITLAHKHSSNHRALLEQSERCGCFHCVSIFDVRAIDEWVDDETTVMCPRCGIDSVIGSSSGFPIDNVFLAAMRRRWFAYDD